MEKYKGMTIDQLKEDARTNNYIHCVKELVENLGISLFEALTASYEAYQFSLKLKAKNQ